MNSEKSRDIDASAVAPLPGAVVRLETTVLQHPEHRRAKKAILDLHRRARSQGMGVHRKLDSRGLLMVGHAREGKTAALHDYARRFPTIGMLDGEATGPLPQGVVHDLRDADYRPIATMSVPSQADLRGFVSAMLGAFGYGAREWWDVPAIIARIRRYVVEMKTDMIFIDEAHNLLNLRDATSTAILVEFLKELLNEIPAQFVVAGLPVLKELPRYAPQFAGRQEPTFTFASYRWNHGQETRRYVGLLKKFEEAIAMPRPSDLTSFDVARRLHVASLGGRIGWTVKLLSRATLAACDAGEDRLDLGRLAEAWAEFDYSDDVGGEPAADYTDERAFEAAVSSGSRLSRDANPFLCDGKRLVPLLGELLRRVDIERRQLAEVMGRSAAINDDEAVTTRGLPRGRDTGLRAAGGGRRLLGRAK